MGRTSLDRYRSDGRVLYASPFLTQLERTTLAYLAFFFLFGWLASLPLAAQEFPALHDVKGVAANDVLNIRSTPSASAAIIGNFAPDQVGVEVTAVDVSGKWGQVNVGESTGWAFLQYLGKSDIDPDYALTREFRCFGTEPFWSLNITQGQMALLSTPNSKELQLTAGLVKTAANRSSPLLLGLGENHAAIIRHEACGDGMSDLSFGLSVDFLTPEDGLSLMTGCCSIAP